MSGNNNRQLGEASWLHVIISAGLGTGFYSKSSRHCRSILGFVDLDRTLLYSVSNMAIHWSDISCEWFVYYRDLD